MAVDPEPILGTPGVRPEYTQGQFTVASPPTGIFSDNGRKPEDWRTPTWTWGEHTELQTDSYFNPGEDEAAKQRRYPTNNIVHTPTSD